MLVLKGFKTQPGLKRLTDTKKIQFRRNAVSKQSTLGTFFQARRPFLLNFSSDEFFFPL